MNINSILVFSISNNYIAFLVSIIYLCSYSAGGLFSLCLFYLLYTKKYRWDAVFFYIFIWLSCIYFKTKGVHYVNIFTNLKIYLLRFSHSINVFQNSNLFFLFKFNYIVKKTFILWFISLKKGFVSLCIVTITKVMLKT